MAATVPFSSSPQAMKQMANLQNGMNKILTAAANLAESKLTHGYRQHTIITQCGELKTKMNELLLVMEGTEVLPTQDTKRAIGYLVADVGMKVTGLKREVDIHLVAIHTIPLCQWAPRETSIEENSL